MEGRGAEAQEEEEATGPTVNGEGTTNMQKKVKKESLIRRVLRQLSLGKKKKKEKKEISNGVKEEKENNAEEKEVEANEPTTKVDVDMVEEKEEKEEKTPVCTRPPLPRSTPSSATSHLSRPVADLDSALRAFQASTRASTNNLRALGSTRDLSLMERVANRSASVTMWKLHVTKACSPGRPCPALGSWRQGR